ncbi:hypothetical protein F4703DRAFT_1838191 [Phycomyces blakesleeanus]
MNFITLSRQYPSLPFFTFTFTFTFAFISIYLFLYFCCSDCLYLIPPPNHSFCVYMFYLFLSYFIFFFAKISIITVVLCLYLLPILFISLPSYISFSLDYPYPSSLFVMAL